MRGEEHLLQQQRQFQSVRILIARSEHSFVSCSARVFNCLPCRSTTLHGCDLSLSCPVLLLTLDRAIFWLLEDTRSDENLNFPATELPGDALARFVAL